MIREAAHALRERVRVARGPSPYDRPTAHVDRNRRKCENCGHGWWEV